MLLTLAAIVWSASTLHPVNTSVASAAFPRTGARRLIDNARINVWDYTSPAGEAAASRFYEKDTLGTCLSGRGSRGVHRAEIKRASVRSTPARRGTLVYCQPEFRMET
jgi:hypothetical protein